MNKQELYDWVKLMFPDLGEKIIEKLANKAMDQFCDDTEIIKKLIHIDGGSVANQRYYNLDKTVLGIKELRINELPISRLLDTGIIDSTVLTTDTEADVGYTSSLAVEPGTNPPGLSDFVSPPVEGALFLDNEPTSNMLTNASGSSYIQFSNDIFDEVVGQRNFSYSLWFKPTKPITSHATLFNALGTDMSNGYFWSRLVGPGNSKGSLGSDGVAPNSVSMGFFPADTDSCYTNCYDSTNSTYHVKGWNQGWDWGHSNARGKKMLNEWSFITLSYNGSSGGNIQIYLNGESLTKGEHPDISACGSCTGEPNNQSTHPSNFIAARGTFKTPLTSGSYLSDSYTKSVSPTLGVMKATSDFSHESVTYLRENDINAPFAGYFRNLSIYNVEVTKNMHNQLWKNGIKNLSDTKDITGSSSVKHFYELKSDTTDSAGGTAVNGTEYGTSRYDNTTMPTPLNQKGR